MLAAADVVAALQSVMASIVAPLDTAVLSCITIEASHAYNVIPETLRIRGTVRAGWLGETGAGPVRDRRRRGSTRAGPTCAQDRRRGWAYRRLIAEPSQSRAVERPGDREPSGSADQQQVKTVARPRNQIRFFISNEMRLLHNRRITAL